MDVRESKKVVAAMKELQKAHEESPEKARAFLVKAGIYTAKGNLRKPYKKSA